MSGIIGSIGSKSGVIGVTEPTGLVYEEGTWTGGIPNVSGPTISNEYYRRIGNFVFVAGKLDFATVVGNTGHGVGISGLPFTAKSNDLFGGTDNGPDMYGGFIQEDSYIVGDKHIYIRVSHSGTSITIGEWNSDFLWSEANSSSGGLHFSCLYLCND